jgi:hypothetical protein
VVFDQHVHLSLNLEFWDCFNDKVYNNNPQMEELKENIHRKIANVPAEQLQSVDQNLFHWCV